MRIEEHVTEARRIGRAKPPLHAILRGWHPESAEWWYDMEMEGS